MMTDRRRLNGPTGPTHPAAYLSSQLPIPARSRPQRTREPKQHRKIFLQTGLTPSASGSAYLELEPSAASTASKPTFLNPVTSPKVTVTIHGPRPLPRSAPFSPILVLSCYVKFAPFATRRGRGYARDNSERDLSAHLESCLRGVVIGDRWPKSGVDVFLTVLEGEESAWCGDGVGDSEVGAWGMMSILAACITAASAALVQSGIDCVDLVTGGVAAFVPRTGKTEYIRDDVRSVKGRDDQALQLIFDPVPSEHEHEHISALCVVGYLATRDELVEVWLKGNLDADETERLTDGAVEAAAGPRRVLESVIREDLEAVAATWSVREYGIASNGNIKHGSQMKSSATDVVMTD